MDTALQTAAHAARAAIHSTLKVAPGALVFGRDMFLNIPIIADLKLIRDRRQLLIDKQLARANRRRFHKDYQPGDEVLKLVPDPNKLEPRAVGPYPIVRTHVNGTLTIRLSPLVTERLNVRRVKPYNR